MENQAVRSSDRIYLELPIVLSGTNTSGREFVEDTRTLVLSRKGAKIISRYALAPGQVLSIRCLKTGLDAIVRVVGPIMGEEEGCHFGVALLHPAINVWGINFPLLDGTENAAGRVFLECANCHSQEVTHLDIFELEVLLANECLTLTCKDCNRPTLWMRVAPGEESLPEGGARPKPRPTIPERKSPRINLKVDLCVRYSGHGEEVATTENISRGGFRFVSHKSYPIGTVIAVALPYSPGAANIFTPARIIHKQPGSIEGTFAHGAAYIPSPVAASLTGMRITIPK
jgi:hypothetical protein